LSCSCAVAGWYSHWQTWSMTSVAWQQWRLYTTLSLLSSPFL
jgi:hypothetical protein